MTTNQIRNLPEGAFLKRKTYRDFEPRFGIVVLSSENDPQPGVCITMAWEQESHPTYNEYAPEDFEVLDEGDNGYRDPTGWQVERIPVEAEDRKTWWRNWKRIA